MLRAVPLLGVMACYSPSPSAGKPCGENGSCPEQLKCSPATNTCEDPSFVPSDDASIDGPVDSQFCFGTGLVTSCLPAAPTTPFDVGTNLTLTLDTTDPANCDLVIDELCVLLGSTVTITGVVRAQGSRPLVIVAASAMTIDGLVDVASRRGQTLPGAGGNAADCTAGLDAVTHTGGWGASFGGEGGSGSLGNAPATGGTAPALPPAPTALRGGCKGGDGAGGTTIGARGDGGGAIYLIAGSSLAIGPAGVVNASGGAGAGCQPDCGGGGGGSGGMIGLDAPTIAVAGEVFANGGGGGEGSQSAAGRAGNESTAANTPGAGGIGGSAGGDGGAGSAGNNLDGVSPTSPSATNAGGGGGGGGAGVIKKHGDLDNQGAISPAPS